MVGRDLIEPKPPKHEVKITSIVATPAHSAAVSPYLDIRQMLSQQAFQETAVLHPEVKPVSHSLLVRGFWPELLHPRQTQAAA